MMRSMTGYAEGTLVQKAFAVKISIRTLNHRFLDWNYRGAPIGALEDRLRNLCQQKLRRGRIDVLLDAQLFGPEAWEFRINEDLIKKIIDRLERASSRAPKPISFSLENLLNIPHVVEFWRKDLTRTEVQSIEGCFEKTLKRLVKERIREGTDIKNQLKIHARNIASLINSIEKRADRQPRLIKQRLKERLEELDQHSYAFPVSRIEEEASFLAQRYDLTEEIARLKSHMRYFRELLESKDPEPVGKKLDFLAQEMYREANTLNSKAQDIEVVQKSLALKSELESVRQQLQNVE